MISCESIKNPVTGEPEEVRVNHGTGFIFIFYFMELLVGLIQATVFTLLSAVYIGLLCNHGDDHDHADEHGAKAHH